MSDTPTIDKLLDDNLARQIELLNLKTAVSDFCETLENFQASASTKTIIDAICTSDKFKIIKNLSK